MAMETGAGSAESKQNSEKPMRIVIVLPSNAYFISGIRDFTLGLIRNTTPFSVQWAYRFQSVVDELCNNAIEYGSAPMNDIKITFAVIHGKYIEINVEDTGTGKKSMKAKDIKALVEKRRQPDFVIKGIRGRGLAKIVAEWTDELEFFDREGGGVRVMVRKRIDVPEEKKQAEATTAGITIHAAPAS